MTKISTAATILALGLGVAIEFIWSRRGVGMRASNALAWAGTMMVCVAVSGWYFARNVREYGSPFVTSFNLSQHWVVAEYENKPVVDRRTLGFLFAWDSSIYVHPFRIQKAGTDQRLFPVAVASTFVDFWGYGCQGYEHPYSQRKGDMRAQYDSLGLARAAVVGGTVIFVATLFGWVAALRRTFRFRDYGRLTVVFVPLSMLAATIQFATKYPVDLYGVVKGIYMSFGTPPLYAAFGIAAGWAVRTRRRLPVFGALVASLLMVAAYSVDCRLWPR